MRRSKIKNHNNKNNFMKPKILFLDEAKSVLDNKSEKKNPKNTWSYIIRDINYNNYSI